MYQIEWSEVLGRTFQTIKGARFTVVRVTAAHVTIRPENGTRDYALSIPKELERVLEAYAAGRFFPAPTELPAVGVRPVLTSYVWGVLHALLAEQEAESKPAPLPVKLVTGCWKIRELSELGADYFELGIKKPFVELTLERESRLYGEYGFGLSSGELDGAPREFDGQEVFIFGYHGGDEMDEAHGCGWLRLVKPNELEGEFLDSYGRFTATRDQAQRGKR